MCVELTLECTLALWSIALETAAVRPNSRSFILTTRIRSPKVELVPKSRRVLQGTNVEFHSTVLNSPNPSKVQWSRQDGQPLPAGNVTSSVLRLVSAHSGDGGRYQCESRNDGAVAYDDAYLEVVEADKKEKNFPVFI